MNQIPFFTSLSKGLYLTTVEDLYDRSVDTIKKCIKHVINVYNSRGFRVSLVCGDGEFEPISNFLCGLGIVVNVTGAHEHVKPIERNDRRIKDCIHASCSHLPLKNVYQI